MDEPSVPDPAPTTGTVMDEFLPIYRVLRKAYGWPQPVVDAMDLSAVAEALGAESDPMASEKRELAELARRRAAGEDVNWEDL
jgi:hypothetical protein